MDLALAMTGADVKAAVLISVTVIAAPIAGVVFARSASAWQSIGKGPFSIGGDLPVPRYLAGREAPIDPAIQAAEVRQMLEAKADRLQRRGESPLDVAAETERLLAPPSSPPDAEARHDAELRDEVRQLVVTRNERRMRRGLEPLDVEAETERQLADFVGSP